MSFRRVLAAVVASAAVLAAGAADAAYVFAGSWRVDQGPVWDGSGETGPLAYSAQEAAALLFGGAAADYVISTAGKELADADRVAWYSILGSGIGIMDQDYSVKYLGKYYGPTSGHDDGSFGVASAYVNDWAVGDRFTNYAFRFVDDSGAIPEPATWALAITGFGLAGAVLRRRRRAEIA
jgi:hypothetical protein